MTTNDHKPPANDHKLPQTTSKQPQTTSYNDCKPPANETGFFLPNPVITRSTQALKNIGSQSGEIASYFHSICEEQEK